MNDLKRWAALALAAGLCVSLLAGCGERASAAEGALSVCVGAAPESLDPIYAETVGDQTILEHLYENLMRVTTDVSGNATVTNGMAKSVNQEKNHDGTVTYTFKLRSAKWSDGRSVKAEDFVYAWQRLVNPACASPYASLLSVVAGYDAVRAGGDLSELQVSAKNDSTLVVVLTGTYDWFLSEVCTAPATMPLRKDVVKKLKEAAGETEKWWSDPTALVTNGAYLAAAYDPAATLTAQASERYYGSHIGPADLTFYFADTAEEAQELYEAKTVDAQWPLTAERMAELAENENWRAAPELSVYTVLFNCRAEVFAEPLVREALNLVIDRNALAAAAGGTASPAGGLVPPGVPGAEERDFRTDGGALLDNDPAHYEETCAAAKELLGNAGYDSGANLGQLEYLYVDEGGAAAVAQTIAKTWYDTLRVQVTPKAVTEEELWIALRGGTYTLAAIPFRAGGNDAECFLMPWMSKNEDNVLGYSNSAYDTLMNIIASAQDGTARMGCLHDAEDLLLNDYVLAPLYTTGTDWDLRDSLTDACRDARGWFCFGGVIPRVS